MPVGVVSYESEHVLNFGGGCGLGLAVSHFHCNS